MEEEVGRVWISGRSGEPLYYAMDWETLKKEAKKKAAAKGETVPEDVRCAGAVLDMLGIPYCHSEAGQEDDDHWFVYWR